MLVVGDVIDDVVVTPSSTPRPDTDTLSSIRAVAGGSAANTAAWLGALGMAVDFVGIVGAPDVTRHTALLSECGVTAHLTAHATLPTGTIVVIVDGEHRTMLTEKGANPTLDLDAIPDALLATATAVHLTGYSLFAAATPAPLGAAADAPGTAAADGGAGFARLIARARQRGMLVSVDPGSAGFIADFGAARFLAAVEGASVLFPNLDEGRLLTGLREPVEVAARLARGFDVVALTLGTDGVVVARADEVFVVPAVPAAIVDPTGAGDAFSAGFLSSWLDSGDLEAAARAGVATAARAVAVIGGRPARA